MDQPDDDDTRHAADRANTGERPNRNVARGEATRGQLIAIATRMFAERGYEDTSIEAVLREAGVSRGSLYHHFASKEALFEAVAEEVETSVGAQTAAAASGVTSPVDALQAGSVAWIRLAGDPVVQRILLIDGPSVLGTPSGWSDRYCRSSRTRAGCGRSWLACSRMCCWRRSTRSPCWSPGQTTKRPRCRPAPRLSTSCYGACSAEAAGPPQRGG
jgi:hypothetical protein